MNQDQGQLCSNISSESKIDVQNNEMMCAEGFYLDNSSTHSSSVCVPLCSYWLSTSRNLGNTVVKGISLIVAIVSSLIMIMLAFWLQRDTL